MLAARLSEDPANAVTLVEAGPARGARSVSYLDDLATPGAVWDGYPAGRGLGGSSIVNGGVLSGGEDDERVDGVLLPRRWLTAGEAGVVDRALLAAADDAETVVLTTASTAEAYLPADVRARDNLTVLTDTAVDRIVLDRRRAVGAVTVDGRVLSADRIVCTAGAIGTPALLLRSGVDTPGIGDELADHPSRTLELELRDGVHVDVHGLVSGAVLRRGAIEIVAMNHLGPSAPGHAALLVGLLESDWTGSVGIAGDGSPVVSFGDVSPRDARALDGGVALARELLLKASFREVVSGFEVVAGSGAYAHACCSCAIGRVADSDGAVRGYSGLYVGDASALPALPASGTYLPVVLLAERLARIWARSLAESASERTQIHGCNESRPD